jgi:hypothetical protein
MSGCGAVPGLHPGAYAGPASGGKRHLADPNFSNGNWSRGGEAAHLAAPGPGGRLPASAQRQSSSRMVTPWALS